MGLLLPHNDELLELMPDDSDAMDNDTPEQSDDDVSETEELPAPENLGVIPEIPETQEESENEDYDDDEGPDDTELLHFTVEAPSPVMRMILHVARTYEETFPTIAGKRHLDPEQFDQMLLGLRRMFWNYRQTDKPHSTRTLVQELIPIGSEFLEHSPGYITPDGLIVNRTMRERVQLLSQRYHEVLTIQRQYQDDVLDLGQMKTAINNHMRQWSLPPLAPPGPPMPVWRGMTLGHIQATVRGRVSVTTAKGKVTMKPQSGPLDWEVCIEDANSPTYFSKN
jgi:hypothetical protein